MIMCSRYGYTWDNLKARYEEALGKMCTAKDTLEWEWWAYVVEECLTSMGEILEERRA